MISPPKDVLRAIMNGTGRRKPRVRWFLNGAPSPGIDMSDRVILDGLPGIDRSVAPMLGGVVVSPMTIALRNDDGALGPPENPASALANIDRRDFLASIMTYEEGVEGEESGWYYFPMHSGIVRDIDWPFGTAVVHTDDKFGALLNWPLAEDYDIDPNAQTASELIQSLITDNTAFTSSDIDSTSFDFAHNVQSDLDWLVFGQIPSATPIGQAVAEIGRSGFGTVYADEAGLIRYDTEFPKVMGGRTRTVDEVALVFDETNAENFTVGHSRTASVTEVNVTYQGVGWAYRPGDAKDNEDVVGRSPATVDMPYLFKGAQAAHSARMLFEIAKDFVGVTAFDTNELGWMAQVNDRIKVKPPQTGVLKTLRVLSKSVTERSQVHIEAVEEQNFSTYIDETFLKEGDSWTSSSLRWV